MSDNMQCTDCGGDATVGMTKLTGPEGVIVKPGERLCMFVADHLPAVSHGGPEVVTDARITVMPYQEFRRMVEPENDDE